MKTRLLSLVVTFVFPAVATAEIPIVESDDLSLSVGAYANNFTSVQHLPYDLLGFAPETTATNAALLRIETRLATENVTAEVHNRFFLRSQTGDSFSSFGLGATQAPERTLDLRSEIFTFDGGVFEHDLDRFAVSWFTPVADFTIGRQAITWGNSNLFTTGDIWTQFSPFEIDTSQKRGVDGVRALAYPWGLELDLVVVDRGDLENLSGGARLAWSLGPAEYYSAVAKNYDRLYAFGGAVVEWESTRFHTEVALPFNYHDGDLELPVATVGFDYFSSEVSVFAEYHFNGYGMDGDNYLAAATNSRVARGEQYLLGTHYGGLAVSYLPIPELTLTGSSFVNLEDPSALLIPSVGYSLSDNTSAQFGAYIGVGGRPDLLQMRVPSEYGSAGFSGFFSLSGFL